LSILSIGVTRYDDIVNIRKHLAVDSWNPDTMLSFVSTMVRGFLRNDLYNSLIELLSRAEGSFGEDIIYTFFFKIFEGILSDLP
jgi:hypothetical protein